MQSQRIMDSQLESGHVADLDVVRSTQFVEEFPRGVRVFFQMVLHDCEP